MPFSSFTHSGLPRIWVFVQWHLTYLRGCLLSFFIRYVLSSNILFSAWFNLLLKLSTVFFIRLTEFFISKISIWLFFPDIYLFAEFLIHIMHCFPIFVKLALCILVHLFLYPYLILLTSLSSTLSISFTLESVTEVLCFWRHHNCLAVSYFLCNYVGMCVSARSVFVYANCVAFKG